MTEFAGLIQMDYRLIYPLGGLLLGVILLAGIWIRKDLRKYVLPLILMHIVFGSLAEVLFFRDYWYPPAYIDFTILGVRVIEGDLILSTVAPPIMAFAFATVFRLFPSRDLSKDEIKGLYIKFFLAELINILIYAGLTLYVGMNSIYAYSLSSAMIWGAIILMRRDLIKLALATLVICGIGTFIFYYVFQVFVGTGYLHDVWLLDPTAHSFNLFGVEVPMTEVIFGALVAPFYGVLVPFAARFKYTFKNSKDN